MAKKHSHKKERISADQVIMPSLVDYDIVVVGGGAAGLAAAMSAAQSAQSCAAKPRILVLEQARRIGSSIMRSGNGRCNFSNAHLDVQRYHNASFVRQAYDAFDDNEALPSVLEWFSSLGLVYSEMPGSGGLLYPVSRKADSVLSVLVNALDESGVEVRPNLRVVNIAREADNQPAGRTIITVENALAEPGTMSTVVTCSQLIFAAGGQYADILDNSSIRLDEISRNPVLAPLEVKPQGPVDWKELDGIRVNARVTIPSCGFSEVGEVLFREYGISGIVVFNASRNGAQGEMLELDLAPDYDAEELPHLFAERYEYLGTRSASSFFDGFLLRPVADAVLAQAGIAVNQPLASDQIGTVVYTMKHFQVEVLGIAEAQSAQVQRGGIAVHTVDPATFSLKEYPAIHVVGEALNVDGPCGGYNLHWAWVSGIAAGYYAATSVLAQGGSKRS